MKALPFLAPFLAAALAAAAHAAPLRSAEVTKAVNDVKLYQPDREGRAANIGDKVSGATSLHTGRRSRAELMFQDRTLSRVGANSVFSFRNGTRDLEIGQGTILLQVPKDAGGATIRTATVTAAITGTTTMMEYSPNHWVKFITLEGTAKLGLHQGKGKPAKFVSIPPGRMIVMHPNATQIPAPLIINLGKLVASSGLAGRSGFGPLPPQAQQLIQQEIAKQMDERRNGDLLPSHVIIQGPGPRQDRGLPLNIPGIVRRTDHELPYRESPHTIPNQPPPTGP
jgi:hypothetical protein